MTPPAPFWQGSQPGLRQLRETAANQARQQSAYRSGGKTVRCAALLARLPGGAVWLAAWHGEVNVHWAFWVLFFSPILMVGLAAPYLGLMTPIVDALTTAWVLFAFTLVWRAGCSHSGWAFVPVLYRWAMGLYLVSFGVLLAGRFLVHFSG